MGGRRVMGKLTSDEIKKHKDTLRRRAQTDKRVLDFSTNQISRLWGPNIASQSRTYRDQNLSVGKLPAPILNSVQKNWWLLGFGNPRHALSEFAYWYSMNPSIYRRDRPIPFLPFRENL